MLRASLAVLLFIASARADPIAWSPPIAAPGGKGLIVAADGTLLFPAAERDAAGTRLRVIASADFGRTFAPRGIVASDPSSRADLGDACLMQSRDGRLWISYRDNRGDVPSYAIKVATSDDGGMNWSKPTLVAESTPPRVTRLSRGLWASCLVQRGDDAIVCVYDDEASPSVAGLEGHQWLTAKRWDARQQAWTPLGTVARAREPADLSRDGMASVVEPRPGELLCVFESVDVRPPHANVLRSVRSLDGGATWSWSTRERDVVDRPAGEHLSIAPWTLRLPDGRLLCVFCTDADRDRPGRSGTSPSELQADVKGVMSGDGGATWGECFPIATTSHRTYLPGVAARRREDGLIDLFVGYLDYAAGGYRGTNATIAANSR